jgi:hypothetical protein
MPSARADETDGNTVSDVISTELPAYEGFLDGFRAPAGHSDGQPGGMARL